MLRWIVINGGCSYVNQYSGLSVLDAMSSPLSHALANVMKRATVITAAMAYQAKPVTPLHVCGVALAVFGAVGYQHTDQCSAGRRAQVSDSDRSQTYELVPLSAKGDVDRGDATAGGVMSSSSSSSSGDSPPASPTPGTPQRRAASGASGMAAFPYPTPPTCGHKS